MEITELVQCTVMYSHVKDIANHMISKMDRKSLEERRRYHLISVVKEQICFTRLKKDNILHAPIVKSDLENSKKVKRP